MSPNVMKEREYWGTWEDYPKVVGSYKKIEDGKEVIKSANYAVIDGRMYSGHAIARMQPSGQRYDIEVKEGPAPRPTSSAVSKKRAEKAAYISMPGIQHFDGKEMRISRSLAPTWVEHILKNVEPIIEENGDRVYISDRVHIVESKEGHIVSILNKKTNKK